MINGIMEFQNEKCTFSIENEWVTINAVNDIGRRVIRLDFISNACAVEEETWVQGYSAMDDSIILMKLIPGIHKTRNSTRILKMEYYIVFKKQITDISKISILCEELNYIYNLKGAIQCDGWNEDGTISIQTKNFEETTLSLGDFYIGSKRIKSEITTSRKIGDDVRHPLQINTLFNLYFSDVRDYDFVQRVFLIVRRFLQYLCYRENIKIDKVILGKELDGGKYERVGEMVFCLQKNDKYENKDIYSRKYIPIELLKDCAKEILQDITDDKLYYRHVPITYSDSKRVTIGRFVLITAALEWEFRRWYPDGIPHKKRTLEARREVIAHLDDMIRQETGKKKDIYKHLKGVVNAEGLDQKIIQLGKDYGWLINSVGESMYELNGERFDWSKIGERIQKQRNNFAHGNLDKELDVLAILDIIFIEKVIYMIQLHYYGLQQEDIETTIKNLLG